MALTYNHNFCFPFCFAFLYLFYFFAYSILLIHFALLIPFVSFTLLLCCAFCDLQMSCIDMHLDRNVFFRIIPHWNACSISALHFMMQFFSKLSSPHAQLISVRTVTLTLPTAAFAASNSEIAPIAPECPALQNPPYFSLLWRRFWERRFLVKQWDLEAEIT